MSPKISSLILTWVVNTEQYLRTRGFPYSFWSFVNDHFTVKRSYKVKMDSHIFFEDYYVWQVWDESEKLEKSAKTIILTKRFYPKTNLRKVNKWISFRDVISYTSASNVFFLSEETIPTSFNLNNSCLRVRYFYIVYNLTSYIVTIIPIRNILSHDNYSHKFGWNSRHLLPSVFSIFRRILSVSTLLFQHFLRISSTSQKIRSFIS